jgi:hypothetical protein
MIIEKSGFKFKFKFFFILLINMTITYFRSPHTPETLNDRFEALFKKTDIVFLEQAMGDAYRFAHNHYNQLSRQGYSASDATDNFFQDFQRKEEYFIRGSGKPIEVERSPFTEADIHIPMKMVLLSFCDFYQGNFKEACKLKLDSAQCSAEINNARDIAIGKQLESLQDANRDKDILALLGGSHEVQIYLDKKGIKVRQEFPYEPYPFGFEDQLERYIRFGKSPTKEIVARSFIGNIFHQHLNNIGIGPPDSITGELRTAEQLSYEDVEALSKNFGNTGKGPSGSEKDVVAWLENKGIEIHHK